MTYPFGLLAPEIVFPWRPPDPDPNNPGQSLPGTGSDVGRRAIRLEDIVPPGFAPLGTAPVLIDSVTMWRQWPGECAGYGDITIGLDHDGRYLSEAEFVKGREFCGPRLLTNIGALEMAPGRLRRSIDKGPWLYRPGRDAIIVCPEVFDTQPGVEIHAFVSFNLLREAPFVYAPGVIYAMPTLKETSGPAYCYRTLVTVPDDCVGGTALRVHITAGALGCSLRGAGVGEQGGSGPDMLAPPALFRWSGQNGPGYGAHQAGYSDWTAFATRPGQRLLFDLWLPNDVWPYRYNGIARTWYSPTDCHARADMPGATPHPMPLVPVFDLIEVA